MTTLNLGGMQSLSMMTGGIDYSQIIEQLDKANRAPGDALNQQIQTYQLKSNDWANIASLASKVQNDLVTLADASTFTSFSATVSGTNSSDVTATGSANASPGTYNLSITQQMVNAAVTGGTQLGNAATLNTSLTSSVFNQPITTGTTVSVTIGSNTTTYTTQSGDTIGSVLSNLFPSGSGVTYAMGTGANANEVQFTNNSGQTVTFGTAGDTSNFLAALGISGLSIATGATAYSGQVGHAQLNQTLNNANLAQAFTYAGAGTISINGVSIDYNTTTDTMQSLINNINASSAGVTAAYDSISDKITLTSKTSQPISVKDVPTTSNTSQTNNLAEVLGLSSTSSVAPVVTQGKPWEYSINGGQTLTSATSSISNVIPGVTFTLSAPPNAISGTTTSLTASIAVAQDSSTLTTNVNAFVADFNNLYHQLQLYTQQGGDLQGDEAASQLAFNYMNDVLGTVQTTTTYPQNNLMEIGISNGALGSAPGTTNTLQVDSNALTSAFANNPNEVQALIQGMASRLNQDLVNVTGQFNTLCPISSTNSNITGVAQAQEDMYSTMIKNTQEQQQTIYNEADQEAQMMQQEFSQLQSFQQQSSLQQNAIAALANTTFA